MDWDGLNEVAMAAVRAAHRAGLPHIATELYRVMPVTNEHSYATLVERVATIKALFRLRPPGSVAWDACKEQFEALYRELEKR